MKTRKWGFFPFDAMDYKAAQAWLDKKAAQGWVLDRMFLRTFARFVPAGGRYHCVDLELPRVFDDQPDADYVRFCEDAGWELAAAPRGMLIFRSRSGYSPAPLQTDAGMEAERFWKKHVRKNVITVLVLFAILIPLLAVLFTLSGSAPFSSLATLNSTLLLLPAAVLALAYLLWSLIATVGSYVHFRRTGRLPQRGRPLAWGMGLAGFLIAALVVCWWLFGFAEDLGVGKTVDVALDPFHEEVSATPELCQSYPVITAADLGLEYSDNSRYLNGRRSLLVDLLDYSEITDGGHGSTHILTTMRYECASETLARWMFSARLRETARGQDFLWGRLEWGDVTSAHGFDQICFARDGSYLLLRQGNTVALVGATGFDWSEHLDPLRQRLELDA